MLIALTVAFSTALAFFMPATLARILLLLPVFGAVAEHAGLARGSKGHNAMKETTRPAKEEYVPTPMRPEERRLAIILIAALVLWATDFAHGIHPGWVALAAGLACLLPMVGVVSPSVLNEKIRLGSFFYIAAVLRHGAALSQSGSRSRSAMRCTDFFISSATATCATATSSTSSRDPSRLGAHEKGDRGRDV